MKIILQSCQEIHLDKFPISGINNLSANLLTRSRNNPTSERVPILPSMATDFREFADDRRSWLTRDCSCCVWGGKDPGHGIDLSSSQTDTGSNYRRFELAVFLRPTRICSRSRPTSQPHPLHPSTTCHDWYSSSLSRSPGPLLARNLPGVCGVCLAEGVFLDTRNDHFNWTMEPWCVTMGTN